MNLKTTCLQRRTEEIRRMSTFESVLTANAKPKETPGSRANRLLAWGLDTSRELGKWGCSLHEHCRPCCLGYAWVFPGMKLLGQSINIYASSVDPRMHRSVVWRAALAILKTSDQDNRCLLFMPTCRGWFVIQPQLTDTPTLISTVSSIFYPSLCIQHVLKQFIC